MKIWIAKDSEVSVREQLSAQITLGIAAGEYKIGERVPSTREIARRCGVHANTVGAVYRTLTNQNLLEFRRGSGFFVAETATMSLEEANRFDVLIRDFLIAASELGFTPDDVIRLIRSRQKNRPPDQVTLIESDPGLRAILLHELTHESFPASAISFAEFADVGIRSRASLVTAMFDEKPKIEGLLRNGQKCVYLHGRSVSAAIADGSRPSSDDLIAIVSGWEGFLSFARIMLLAAGVAPGNLIVRSMSDADWQQAINPASIVICDSLAASHLQSRPGVRSFRIISDQSIAELKANLDSNRAS